MRLSKIRSLILNSSELEKVMSQLRQSSLQDNDMEPSDRERLIRIETILTESIAPQVKSFGPRIKRLENIALFATFLWGSACVVAYVAKDTASEWMKRKVLGQ